jgi:hypothetical protein
VSPPLSFKQAEVQRAQPFAGAWGVFAALLSSFAPPQAASNKKNTVLTPSPFFCHNLNMQ